MLEGDKRSNLQSMHRCFRHLQRGRVVVGRQARRLPYLVARATCMSTTTTAAIDMSLILLNTSLVSFHPTTATIMEQTHSVCHIPVHYGLLLRLTTLELLADPNKDCYYYRYT